MDIKAQPPKREALMKPSKAPIGRVASLDIPTPASHALEARFYAGKADIVSYCREILGMA